MRLIRNHPHRLKPIIQTGFEACGSQFKIPFSRIGEAKCPGPQQQIGPSKNDFDRWFLTKSSLPDEPLHEHQPLKSPRYPSDGVDFHLLQISIANPTSINGRSNEVCSWGRGIHFLAETACTQQTFRKESRVVNKNNMVFSHGQFPKPMMFTKKGAPSAKGQCMGVGMITSIPHRPFAGQEKIPAWKACRLCAYIFYINKVEVLGVGAYFFQQCYHNAVELNSEIHEQILELLSSWQGPTFVAADFNCDIRYSHIYQFAYQQHGMCDIRTLHDRCGRQPLPPTTEGSTITDTILVSNWFAERFHSAFVREDTIIPTHAPVHSFFHCDRLHFDKFVWALPAPFPCSQFDPEHLRFHAETSDSIDQSTFEEALQSGSADDILRVWSEQAEQCFSSSAKTQHDLDPKSWPFPKLKDRFFGRGKLPERVKVKPAGYIKQARHGDFQPSVETIDVVTKQKVKQVRRIQGLWNRVNHQSKVNIDPFNHQNIQEWTAITTAAGYGKCFLQWLLSHSDLEFVNCTFPTGEQLKALLIRVKADADKFMRGKGWQQKKTFEKTIQNDWNENGGRLTFTITADKPLLGFNSMKVPKVIHVKKSKWCKKGILSWKYISGSLPRVGDQIEISKKLFDVIEVIGDTFQIKAQQCHNDFFPKECETLIHTWAYSPNEMADGFFTYWSKYWLRDEPVDSDEQWHDALKYVESIPQCEAVDLSIDADSLEKAIQSTPSNSARGLCGWGIRELKIIPRNFVVRLATLLNHCIENEWPRVLTWVRLALPPKCLEPSRPEHGRPICVMSIIYRLGAKVIARKLLNHLSSLLPQQICGGIPGRDATSVWYGIQAQIERAHFQNDTLVGFCMDIQKCYNAIPRRVVIHALIRAGVPQHVAWSWYRLLMNLHRSVVIQNSASQMVPSTTGIPEGDPIAVPAMAIICWIFWNATSVPQCTPWTYADNWEFVASSVVQLTEAVKRAISFMKSWKLDIDVGKSWSWSTKPLSKNDTETLSNILSSPSEPSNHPDESTALGLLKSVKSQKDLGATMRYRKILSVQDTKERFQKSIHRIRRLSSVPCSLEQLCRAINVGAISCALYGIELLPLGLQHFQKLRSSIADTICDTYKNRSEWLATACCQLDIGDPEVKAIKKCIRTCRKFLVKHPELIQISFEILAETSAKTKKVFGPLGSLKRWLERLGWRIIKDGCIVTRSNIVLSILFTCPTEIAYHVDVAWSDIVIEQVAHRKGMENLPSLNFSATSKNLGKFGDVDKKIICKYIAGAFAHGDKNFHRGSKKPDSLIHRIHSCPAFSDIRNEHIHTLQWINECCQHWNATPIIPHHPDEGRWNQIKNIVTSPLITNITDNQIQIRRFFTDGSCKTPSIPEAAFASWSVVEDFSQTDEERIHFAKVFQETGARPQCFVLSRRNQVCGRQTNDRAELSAIIYAISQSHLVEIFTDSMYAINVLTKILDGALLHEYINDTNADLIQELSQATMGRTWTHIAIHHVRSHQDMQRTSDMLLLFTQLGNDEADRHAGLVWDIDVGSTVQFLVNTIMEHYTTMGVFHIDFLTFLCRICKRFSDLSHGKQTNGSTENQRGIDTLKQWTLPVGTQSFDGKLEPWMTISLPHPSHFVKHVAAYFDSLVWPLQPQVNDPGISWLELFIDCLSATACRVPNQRGRYSNQYILVDPLGSNLLERDSLNQMISTFRSCVKFLGRILKRSVFPTEFQQTKCESLLFFEGGKITSGFSARPKLLCPDLTVDSICKYHQRGAHQGRSSKFNDNFPFDFSGAFLKVPANDFSDPLAEKRINRFGAL